MLMSFRACVFWANALVTAALGFLIIVPRALCWNMLVVFVRHMLETGEVMRFIVFSNWAPLTCLDKYSAKTTFKFFWRIYTTQKPN